MQKHYSIVNNYFSLLSDHIDRVTNFNKQAQAWLFGANDIYFEALTFSIFRKNLVSFSQKIIVTVQEINNLSNNYLEKLRLLSNVIEMLITIESSSKK